MIAMNVFVKGQENILRCKAHKYGVDTKKNKKRRRVVFEICFRNVGSLRNLLT